MLSSVSPQKIAPPLVRLGAHAALRATSAASAASAALALPAALSRSRTFSSLLVSSRRSSSWIGSSSSLSYSDGSLSDSLLD